MEKILLDEMALDMNQIAENLNAFEKFFDALPEKAISLGVRVLIAAVLFFVGSKLIQFTRKITKSRSSGQMWRLVSYSFSTD